LHCEERETLQRCIAPEDESVATGEVHCVAMEGKRALHQEGTELQRERCIASQWRAREHCTRRGLSCIARNEMLQRCIAMGDESVATGEVRSVAMGKRALHWEGAMGDIHCNIRRWTDYRERCTT